jgi:hypothetical protein
MAVLVEANSVIVRMQAIRDRYAGGWSEFADAVPNNTLCSDDEIAGRIYESDDCDAYIGNLERSGLTFLRDGQSQDIAITVQTDGITVPCEWLEFVRIEVAPGQLVAAVRLKKGAASRQVHCQENWSYEKSLSRQFAVVPADHLDKSLTFLRHENGLDVYLNALTGEEVYIGRPNLKAEKRHRRALARRHSGASPKRLASQRAGEAVSNRFGTSQSPCHPCRAARIWRLRR